MRTIRIDNEADSWMLWPNEWKGYVYGPEEDFDEVFVITGNRDYKGLREASWYKDAVEYLENNYEEVTLDNIMETLTKLFPNDTFEKMEINGFSQNEWQYVIYKTNAADFWGDDLKETLEDFYFGYVTEIYNAEDKVVTYVGNQEMWKYEDDQNKLKDFICDLIGIDPDEDVQFLVSDGYEMAKKWKAI